MELDGRRRRVEPALAILESRISRVAARGRKVLDTLAVGEPLPVDLLTDLYGADALVEVEQLGLAMVDEREDQQVRLCHPLYGEALRAAMGTVERRRVMARLADSMADDRRRLASRSAFASPCGGWTAGRRSPTSC